MSVESTGWGLTLIIITMAIVTLATRWGGVYVMSFVPISSRVRQFINAMSGSVLVAVLVPQATAGDNAARLALSMSAAVMLATKKPLPAILMGILTAAVYRRFIEG